MAHPTFQLMYPRSTALGLEPVESTSGNEVAGFDLDAVAARLGETRFQNLMAGLKEDFVCGHRAHPPDHPEERLRGTEVHCLWAKDLEAFLDQEGR